jgi:hypothetical protein
MYWSDYRTIAGSMNACKPTARRSSLAIELAARAEHRSLEQDTKAPMKLRVMRAGVSSFSSSGVSDWLCANIRVMADRPRLAFGLVIALALGVSGCGSTTAKTTSTAGSSASSTPAQFIAQASRICQGVSAQEQPLKTREESLKNLPVAQADKAFVSLARQAASIAQSADEQLRALPRPSADAQAISQLVQAYSEEAADANDIANAAVHQESGLGESASRALARSTARNSASAQKLGMGACFQLR